jgi:glycosyltransferase involved in cell wall biosynthesis
MRNKLAKYHLIHVITGGEFLKPLVINQVFERAHSQASIDGPSKPISVSVWILEPMRIFLSRSAISYVKQLRRQFPNIKIQIFGGVNRLGNFPMKYFLLFALFKKRGAHVIFHCRGESCFELLKNLVPENALYRFLLDIRGYWPLEFLSQYDVFLPEKADPFLESTYTNVRGRLDNTITSAHGIFTVSNPLKKFLINEHSISSEVVVVPCCVEKIFDLSKRGFIRNQLGISEKNAFLYLGSVTRYQHIEDLVLPFMLALTKVSTRNVAVLLTQDIEAMNSLVNQFDFPKEQVLVMSVPKSQINIFTSAMDAGLLLRVPSLLNSFAQPVKFGEYLANGLPVIVEKGTGEIEDFIKHYGIGKVVSTYDRPPSEINRQAFEITKWIEEERQDLSLKARGFVSKNYTWNAYLELERNSYLNVLY